MNIRSWFRLCCLLLPVTAALIALPACSAPKPEAPKAVEKPAKPPQPPLAAPVEPGLNIGDVEAGIIVAATVPPEGLSPQVAVENMETKRDRLAMSTITVKPPYPEKLTLRVTLTPKVSYVKQPVVVRGKLRRDEKPLEPEFSTVVSEGGPTLATTIKCDFDIMQGLATPPETMLVYAQFDAYLMPMDTPITGIDPKTSQSDQHTELLSNPVRVYFAK